jgi:hypothetical protein
MGRQLDVIEQNMAIFEKEMRIRLWWQLRRLADRSLTTGRSSFKPQLADLGDIRLPLNVNDADLHVGMTETPAESSGPTEMVCVLTRQ